MPKSQRTRAKKKAKKPSQAKETAVDDVTVEDMTAEDVFLHESTRGTAPGTEGEAEHGIAHLPAASSLGEHEFSKITYEQCNTSVLACDDRLKEFTGCDPEDISNCWNCIYPLTEAGYFCGLEWDREDPKNAVLHQAIARLKVLYPLSKTTFGIPIQRSSTGVIETQGSCCGREHGGTGCVKRVVEDDHAYNVSEQDALVTSMAMDAGLPIAEVGITCLPKRTLKMFGGIYTHQQYWSKSKTHTAAALRSDLLSRKPTIVQEVEKETVKVVKSKFKGYLMDISTAEPVVIPTKDGSDLSTTETTYATNMEELEKDRKRVWALEQTRVRMGSLTAQEVRAMERAAKATADAKPVAPAQVAVPPLSPPPPADVDVAAANVAPASDNATRSRSSPPSQSAQPEDGGGGDDGDGSGNKDDSANPPDTLVKKLQKVRKKKKTKTVCNKKKTTAKKTKGGRRSAGSMGQFFS